MLKLLTKMRSKKGFTLVELMVVVVIIGILVAIAIPVYNGVQSTAKNNAVSANVRILESSYQVYKADHDSATPASANDLVPNYVKVWPAGPANAVYTINVTTGTVSVNGTAQ